MSREKTSLHDATNDEPSFVVESELSEKENLTTSDEKKNANSGEETKTDDVRNQDESLDDGSRNDEKNEEKEIADLESGDNGQEKKLKSAPAKKAALIAFTSAAIVDIGVSFPLRFS